MMEFIPILAWIIHVLGLEDLVVWLLGPGDPRLYAARTAVRRADSVRRRW